MTDPQVILVIDDSEVVLERIRSCLEAAGYRVITTTQTVGVGRHLLESQLVIIDWYMPGIDGGELLASLRGAIGTSHARPLFYLYTSDHSVMVNAKSLGFDGHFINKGNDQSLVRQVEAAFRLTKFMSRTPRKDAKPPDEEKATSPRANAPTRKPPGR
jgi:DNA-binding NarL/FixJ family response regulator